ncbi:triphosphoribosyl-dephospho-CoA synthase [Stutzerimonas kirkiae]|uniref:Probable 2-(5''-triphosphoribosyl)-3'-dephosphocoenzyme-A synthase n=1 Tax=Stutzerimonas kirkiae TaxID=2211392 RepID=A0A4Q9R2L8_9GAMM|nr:triphosphoribosyl-dephospho-CoA synthase [Stutzerimonas kirkiae]TBU93310.1 triphosphoribosyl-dephospho-CoA synthase MdcB [Stutzerimonas kirkiae]TBV01444.1 triphosphoribosyl-dephospho-CoA synthase MdcB [Stutzerimonas kirkiae]TBV06860.1 triphosphoribosyl-dephospho-CoA synthase MdcB [Stutzerimonas kirkiae]TBV10361.1 triphosphoribosyl-dephospho-CoA synthase MdcB [Stutzerimonas kirkiae]
MSALIATIPTTAATPASANAPSPRPRRRSQAAPGLAERLADLAVQALLDEAHLSPKPGLVDRRGSGAHDDLHLGLMIESAHALWPTFKAMAEAARQHAAMDGTLRATVGRLGREGEARMLRVTGGVNTHRGAIWALGLLSSAAAIRPDALDAAAVTARAAALAALDDPALPVRQDSHGAEVRRRYGVPGAREQAQQGFPAVIQHGLVQLRRSRANAAGEQSAQLDALLAIMTTLPDTCVLHRAGMAGLNSVQQGAHKVLQAGGCAQLAGRRQLRELERDMLALRASPGGAADLLAATLFLDRLAQMPAQTGRS